MGTATIYLEDVNKEKKVKTKKLAIITGITSSILCRSCVEKLWDDNQLIRNMQTSLLIHVRGQIRRENIVSMRIEHMSPKRNAAEKIHVVPIQRQNMASKGKEHINIVECS